MNTGSEPGSPPEGVMASIRLEDALASGGRSQWLGRTYRPSKCAHQSRDRYFFSPLMSPLIQGCTSASMIFARERTSTLVSVSDIETSVSQHSLPPDQARERG